ncbi:MAG: PIN domain-containing protein [Polyangiaceae bacterium]|nr:PIN domain-containing protein [Polyangiaceae bacterium]
MIAVDTNVLVFAHRKDSVFHAAASRCVRELAEGVAPWAVPWPCVHEFLAIATHPRRYLPPSPLGAAIDQLEAWFEAPGLVLIGETHQHWDVLKATAQAGMLVGPVVHDARIAAICIENGVSELWTADRDFSRIPSLKTRNPLIG